MIVIFEQDYDVVSIMDVINDDKFDEYVNYYRHQLLFKNNIIEICEEQDTNSSYNYKVKYEYTTEWYSFNYVKFESLNNFELEK